MDDQTQYLLDRLAIDDVVRAYSRGCDTRDFALLRRTFAPDARAKYAVDDWLESGAAIVDWLEERTQGTSFSQHVITPQAVEVNGDTATLAAHLVSRQIFEGKPDVLIEMTSGYGLELRREPQGWRITQLVLTVAYLEQRESEQDELMQRTSRDVPLTGADVNA